MSSTRVLSSAPYDVPTRSSRATDPTSSTWPKQSAGGSPSSASDAEPESRPRDTPDRVKISQRHVRPTAPHHTTTANDPQSPTPTTASRHTQPTPAPRPTVPTTPADMCICNAYGAGHVVDVEDRDRVVAVLLEPGRSAVRASTTSGVGEAPGRWQGRGLEALGLDPKAVVSERELEALFGRAMHRKSRQRLGKRVARGRGNWLRLVFLRTEVGQRVVGGR